MNILIVDDCQIIRTVVKRVIEIYGIEFGLILEAGNGKEALDILNTQHFDLVIADQNMPVMTGEDMIKSMKNNPKTKDIPIIMISAESNISKIDSFSNECISFIHKPFTHEALGNKLLKLFNI